MENIYKKFLLSCTTILMVLSCTTYEYEEPNNTAGLAQAIHDLDLDRNSDLVTARVGDVNSYNDVSIDADGRSWVVTVGAIDILGSDEDTTTDRQRFTARFIEEGPVEIVLRPIFDSPVPEDLAEVTLRFDILAELIASFTTDIPMVNGVPTVEAGRDVTFTNTSSETSNVAWTFTNNTNGNTTTSSSVSPVVKFGSTGSYTATLTVTSTNPAAESSRSFNFTVVPSTEPLTIEPNIFETVDGEIRLTYSRDLDPDTLDDSSAVEILVDGSPVAIESIIVDPSDPSSILVKPTVNIGGLSSATIAYTVINLRSADGVLATSLPATSISFNLIPLNANFENGDLSGFSSGDVGFEISSDQVQDGSFSLKVTSASTTTISIATITTTNPFQVKAGENYQFEYWIYIEDPSTATDAQLNVRTYPATGFSDAARVFQNLTSGVGTWVKKTRQFSGSEFPDQFLKTFFSVSPRGEQVILYIDNITLVEL